MGRAVGMDDLLCLPDTGLVERWHAMQGMLSIVRALALFFVLMACMLGGIFAAAGVCAVVFGPSVLDTTLGDQPDRSHPAFWLFMTVMVPGMLVGAAGAMFGVILPVAARWPVAGIPGNSSEQRLLRAYLAWVGKLVPEEPERVGDPAAGDHSTANSTSRQR